MTGLSPGEVFPTVPSIVFDRERLSASCPRYHRGLCSGPRETRGDLLMAARHSSGHVQYAPAAGAPRASTFVARETGAAEAPRPRLLDHIREATEECHSEPESGP